MNPISFPEQNCTHIANGCMDLPTCRQHNEQFQTEEIISLWELSDDDCVEILKQIRAGIRPAIHLSVIGGQPPVSLFVRARDYEDKLLDDAEVE